MEDEHDALPPTGARAAVARLRLRELLLESGDRRPEVEDVEEVEVRTRDMAGAFRGRFITLPLVGLLVSVMWFTAACRQAADKTATSGTASPTTGVYVPARTPDGQPDIAGMYEPGW